MIRFSSPASERQRKTQNDFVVLFVGRWTLDVGRWAFSFVDDLMNSASLHAIASVAYKEFLHIYRDRRVLLLLLILPPLFTLLFGHAFETSEINDVPAMLINRDNNPQDAAFHRYRCAKQDFSLATGAARDHERVRSSR